jgi:hypothetical protein
MGCRNLPGRCRSHVPRPARPCALRAYVAFYVTSEPPLRYFPSKTQFKLFLVGELLWHRQACAGTYRQPTYGTCSVLLDAASPWHVSPPDHRPTTGFIRASVPLICARPQSRSAPRTGSSDLPFGVRR